MHRIHNSYRCIHVRPFYSDFVTAKRWITIPFIYAYVSCHEGLAVELLKDVSLACQFTLSAERASKGICMGLLRDTVL